MTDIVQRLTQAIADRYTIEREIGAGGMATVYLAEDLKHQRKVAIKVLRPELAAALGADRFLNEIRVTANLQHPHILPLHDSGTAVGRYGGTAVGEQAEFLYYVMPYVEGESLRERLNRERQLTVDDALSITTEVADALGSAHRQGVVHRDIKPENILLREGHALVADFGIALAVTSAGGDRLTETGLSLGTPAYMSPEQVAGEREIDARSDIYSLACVLYEMLAGQPPFTGASAQAVLARHVTDQVPPLTTVRSSVSQPVAVAIERALGKAPADRFDSAAAFATALSAKKAERADETKSIVVLPFDNLSPDPDNAFFADGLTEEIIADLSKVSAMRVISRTSAMAFQDTTKTVPAIAAELNVRYVLEGSVRRAGNNLRITAQLIDSSNDAHLWAEKYSGTMDDVFDLQEQLSRRIVDALEVTLAPEEDKRLAAHSTSDPRALEAWLRAAYEARRFTEEGIERAIRITNEALATVGEDPILYASLAYALFNGYDSGFMHDDDTLRRAEESAAHALELDPDQSQATLVIGLVHYKRGDWKGLFRHAKRAVDSERNAETLTWLAYAYMAAGITEEARRYGDEAMARDPLSPWALLVHTWTFFLEGNIEAAVSGFREAAEGWAADVPPAVWWAGTAAAFAGMNDEALIWLERAAKMNAGAISDFAELQRRALVGDAAGVRDLIDTRQLREVAKTDEYFSLNLAMCLGFIGDRDEALEWIDHAIDWGFSGSIHFETNIFLEPLYDDPRFHALMDKARELQRQYEVLAKGG